MSKLIVSVDPSGNFVDGKGQTGIATIHVDNQYQIEDTYLKSFLAKDFEDRNAYWHSIVLELSMLNKAHDISVVCESYQLRESKSKSQSWSYLETPQLIGVLTYYCYVNNIPFHLQTPSSAKRVWSDDRLVHEGHLEKVSNRYYHKGHMTNDHMRDALRHGLLHLSKRRREYEKETKTK